MPESPGGLYDELLYGDLTFFYTHPNHLAGVAALCGLPAPPLAGCRVLELACGTGFNIIGMSHSMPTATFVGVDLAEKQICHGKKAAAALGVTNVELRAGPLEAIDASFGEFDFILAHGVFSWVPPDVQRALLRVVRERLAPNGLAFVSYNVLPGWGTRNTVRDLMRLLDPTAAPPADRVRRSKAATHDFLTKLPPDHTHYADTLRRELAALADQPDYYILAEHLTPFNRPMYFTDFVGLLKEHGLQHAADSEYQKNLFARPEDERTAMAAAGDDGVGGEQFLDFHRQRDFRQSILCHAAREVPRWPHPALVLPLWLTPRVAFADPNADPDGPFDVVCRDADTFNVHDPVFRRILRRVLAAPGRKVRVDACLPDLADLDLPFPPAMVPSLLASAVAQGAADELWTVFAADPPFAIHPGDRPRACRFALHEAAAGPSVTNRFHYKSRLGERDRVVFLRLDGRSTRDELAAMLGMSRADLDASLTRLAAAAVIEE